MTDQPLPEGMGLAVLVEKLLKERDLLTKQLSALRWQVEHEGCASSYLGETTYECHVDFPCGLCRLRAERDRLRDAIDAAPDLLAALEAVMETRTTPWRKDAIKANQIAVAAIAKARGEKP